MLLFNFFYSINIIAVALIFIPIFYNNKYSTIFEVSQFMPLPQHCLTSSIFSSTLKLVSNRLLFENWLLLDQLVAKSHTLGFEAGHFFITSFISDANSGLCLRPMCYFLKRNWGSPMANSSWDHSRHPFLLSCGKLAPLLTSLQNQTFNKSNKGGVRAVVLVDTIQLMIMIVGTIICLIMVNSTLQFGEFHLVFFYIQNRVSWWLAILAQFIKPLPTLDGWAYSASMFLF